MNKNGATGPETTTGPTISAPRYNQSLSCFNLFSSVSVACEREGYECFHEIPIPRTASVFARKKSVKEFCTKWT